MYGSSRETKVPEFGDESQSSVREGVWLSGFV